MEQSLRTQKGITIISLIITIILIIILAAVTIKSVSNMNIVGFGVKGAEDYSKAQDKEKEDFGEIENLITGTISNIESGNTPITPVQPEEPVKKPFTEEDIGKYVNYTPIGTDYTVEGKYSGYSSSQVFTQNTNLKWQIWKIEDDILYLISDKLPTKGGYNSTGNLLITGAQGYNNGVTLLDNICLSNYGINGNNDVKARNLKLEDILEVKAETVKPEEVYETQPNTYPASGKPDFAFPSIWYNNERESLELAKENRSKAYQLVETNEATILSSNQKPFYTYWENANMNNVEAWKREEYYTLIMGQSQSKTYWLSSRYVWSNSSTSCLFGLQHIRSSGVHSYNTYYYNNGSPSVSTPNYGIRPIVAIPLSKCEITENSNISNTFDILIK